MKPEQEQELRRILEKWSYRETESTAEARQGKSIWRYVAGKWMAFARILGRANTIVLLTLFYLVLLGPVALLFKMLGKDLLDRGFEKRESYWYDREKDDRSIERSGRQF